MAFVLLLNYYFNLILCGVIKQEEQRNDNAKLISEVISRNEYPEYNDYNEAESRIEKIIIKINQIFGYKKEDDIGCYNDFEENDEREKSGSRGKSGGKSGGNSKSKTKKKIAAAGGVVASSSSSSSRSNSTNSATQITFSKSYLITLTVGSNLPSQSLLIMLAKIFVAKTFVVKTFEAFDDFKIKFPDFALPLA
ncbi:uncharacterized protein ASCRUDRAFT_9340 [Ascoidea rubescens DSM 1968]|uniref:Uncharacterized protein n=1 Tax=Ascoidea rubescens DSM 1968 TaxID=1344418 RepID=A0A1D2VDW4_9ASCO|nr:hypothetical protein ASCRUDRAFT_9340 [Ascoidea rubescens DSM 1968]ODV59683.1 hypothetical protein ASCRUDRAFT_9340 [Ascoidea rubescens DSM 1968]